jgi:diguanylate cyclase (GGDEF)-like protein
MPVGSKILRAVYRFMVPGGLLLLVSALVVNAGTLQSANPSFWHNYPYFIFGAGLLLSAIFNRSRLFFAILIVALSDRALVWLAPRLATAGVHRTIFDAIALLLPLNLLALSFMRDRGIISMRGRRRVAFIAAQMAIVSFVILVRPVQVLAASAMNQAIVPKRYAEWSRISQPALLTFVLAGVAMLVYLLYRRRPVESGLFWALVTSFIALNAGGAGHLSSAYFATGGVILGIAVLETSYTMAYRDELTQLPSRRALNESLLKVGDTYTLAMVDVDHFKQFNDTYGHETGDQVLQMIASRLADVSGGGKAFRYGGEEFAVMFPNKVMDEAYPSLETLRKSIEDTNFKVRDIDRRQKGKKKTKSRPHGKKEVTVTVSIGAAAHDGEQLTPDQVLRAADKALYRAKKNGRNCTAVTEVNS